MLPRTSKFNLVKLLLFSVMIFLCLENVIFRYALYPRILSPRSYGGTFYYLIQREKERWTKDSPRKDIIIVGDSRIDMAFLENLAEDFKDDQEYRFVNAGIPSTSIRSWHYLLRELMKDHHYHAVAIEAIQYDDVDLNLPDSMLDVKFTLPFLSWDDFSDMAGSFYAPEFFWKTWQAAILNGLNYKADFQEFLLRPFERIRLVHDERTLGRQAAYMSQPPIRDLVGLTKSQDGTRLNFPASVKDEEKVFFERVLLSPPQKEKVEVIRNYEYWLQRIVELCRSKGTELYFFKIPGRALPTVSLLKEENSVIRRYAKSQQIHIFPETRFDFLQDSKFFTDPVHYNLAGARLFTHGLVEEFGKIYGFKMKVIQQ